MTTFGEGFHAKLHIIIKAYITVLTAKPRLPGHANAEVDTLGVTYVVYSEMVCRSHGIIEYLTGTELE